MTEEVKRPDVYGSALFCDDIRFEADGKVSYIGTYTARMVVHTPFPITLPKFGLAVELYQKKSVFQETMKLIIFLPTDDKQSPSIETELHGGRLGPRSDQKRPYVLTKANLVFAPFIIEATGLIRVRVRHGDKLHPLGTLLVEQAQAGVPQGEGDAGRNHQPDISATT